MARSILLFLIILLITPLAASAEVSLTIDPRFGSTTQIFTFGVRVTKESPSKAPQIEDNDDFTVRYVGPQQNVRIVNGTVSQETTFFYRLKPKHEGSLTTPEVTVDLPSGRVTPDPIEIVVSEGPSGGAKNQISDVLVEQSITPNIVFRGQQIVDVTSILTPYELRDLRYNSPPLADFWEEAIRPDERDQEIRNNQAYSVIRMRAALFPLKSGQLTLPAKSASGVAIRSQMGSLLDDMDPFNSHFMSNFFSLAPDTIEASSNTEAVTVKDLPALPPDASLWNSADPLVGSVRLEAHVPSNMIRPGDAQDITVTLTTDGNANTITALPIQETKRWKIYAEQPKTTSQYKDGKLIYTKVFHTTLIPNTGGDITLPELRLTYFDPSDEQYKIASTGPIHISVTGTPEPTFLEEDMPSPSAKSKSKTKLKNEERDQETSALEESNTRTPWLLALGTLFFAAAFWTFFNRSNKGHSENFATKTYVAQEAVLSDAMLYKVFTQAIESRFGIQSSPASLRTLLQNTLHDTPLRYEIESLLDELEERLYGRARDESSLSFEELREKVYLLIKTW